jgi:uncharacterized alkaline shock family protein YloU
MTLVDRLLLLIMFLTLFAMGVFLLAAGAGGWDPRPWLEVIGQAVTGPYRLQTALIGLAVLLASSYLLAWALRRRFVGRALVRQTELGAVRVSLKAVESLVQRAARQVQGVRDVRVDLHVERESVGIQLTVTVAPDLAIPTVSDEVQHRVERYVLETLGVTVSRVAVTFRAIADQAKARVE